MKNFLKKFWFILIIVAFLSYFFIFANKNEEKQPKTYIIKTKNLQEKLTFSGKIDAEEKVVLRFQTSGRLAWVGVKEGDYVKKYQLIASLDQRDLKNRLQKYLNNYASTRLDFERTKDKNWNKQYDLSETIRKDAEVLLKQNQYNLEQTVLDVEYQNLLLEYANLYSPIEGIVTRVDVPIGGVNITPASAEFEIVNPKTLYFQASADQTEVINLQEGKTGTIVFDAYPDEEVKGKITYIGFSPKKDETGTVYEVKISFENKKNRNYKLGMTGDINFIAKERKNIIAIPQSFLQKDKKGDFVFVKKNNSKEKRYLILDEEIDGEVIVKSGLKPKEIIVEK